MKKETFNKIKEELKGWIKYSTDAMFYENKGKAKFTVVNCIYDQEENSATRIKNYITNFKKVAERITEIYGVKAEIKKIRYQGFITRINIICE